MNTIPNTVIPADAGIFAGCARGDSSDLPHYGMIG